MRRLLDVAAVGLLMFSLLAIGLPLTARASSHREAPSTSVDPMADNTDVYAFRDPNDPTRVNIIANYIPFQLAQGGPNFYRFDDNINYAINIDNNGDAIPDIRLEWRFSTLVRSGDTFLYNTGQVTSLDDPDLNIRQVYTVTALINGVQTTIASNVPVPPTNIGPRSTPNYEANLAQPAITTVNTARGAVTLFAGQRDDPFFIDIGSFFDLLGLRPFNDPHIIRMPNAPGVDGLAGVNVSTIAVQMPITAVTANGATPTGVNDPNAIVGVWATASRRSTIVFDPNRTGAVTFSGDFTQVSRLGQPLVNELIVPLNRKDRFNASFPSEDMQFLPFVQRPEPARLIDLLYGPNVDVPPDTDADGREDVVTVFLTGVPGLNRPANVTPSEQARLNLAVPPAAIGSENRLGVLGNDLAGFPNGRRPQDDVVDIELRVLAGVLFQPPAGQIRGGAFDREPNNRLGDGVNENDRPFLTRFPYIATPWAGYDSPGARTGTTDTNAPSAVVPEPTPRP